MFSHRKARNLMDNSLLNSMTSEKAIPAPDLALPFSVLCLHTMGDIQHALLTIEDKTLALQQVLKLLGEVIPFTRADVLQYDFDAQEVLILSKSDVPFWPLLSDNDRIPLFPDFPTSLIPTYYYTADLLGVLNPTFVQRVFREHAMRSLLLTIMPSVDIAFGLICLGTNEACAFSSEQQHFVGDIANLVSHWLRHKQTEREQHYYTFLLEATVEKRVDQLQQVADELAKANVMKSEFMAAVSHELRTPLNAILNKGEVLHEEVYGELTVKQRRAVDVILENGHGLLKLINNLLDISQLETGDMAFKLSDVSATAVAQEAIRTIQIEAQTKQITIVTQLLPEPVIVTIDKERFKQILLNLLDNAIKFTPNGGQIGLDLTLSEDQLTVQFTIWDTGIGIEQEKISLIFLPFTQADSRVNRQYAGVGLGLPLVNRLVQLHNGNITVTSQIGQGSQFAITIPRTN